MKEVVMYPRREGNMPSFSIGKRPESRRTGVMNVPVVNANRCPSGDTARSVESDNV